MQDLWLEAATIAGIGLVLVEDFLHCAPLLKHRLICLGFFLTELIFSFQDRYCHNYIGKLNYGNFIYIFKSTMKIILRQDLINVMGSKYATLHDAMKRLMYIFYKKLVA